MSRNKKLFLGVCTVWPIAYTGLFIMLVFSQFVLMSSSQEPGFFFTQFAVVFVLHGLTMLGTLVLLVYYVYHAFNNPRLADGTNKQLLWVLILFVGNQLAMPIYWYKHIWSVDSSASYPDLRPEPTEGNSLRKDT